MKIGHCIGERPDHPVFDKKRDVGNPSPINGTHGQRVHGLEKRERKKTKSKTPRPRTAPEIIMKETKKKWGRGKKKKKPGGKKREANLVEQQYLFQVYNI